MDILIDSHILLWALKGDTNIPEKAKDYILNPANRIFFSSATIWELSIKHSLHSDNIPFSGKDLLSKSLYAGFIELPVCGKYTESLETLKRNPNSPEHKDPFDRMLIAQAKYENMRFLTHDSKLPAYNEPCILYV